MDRKNEQLEILKKKNFLFDWQKLYIPITRQ